MMKDDYKQQAEYSGIGCVTHLKHFLQMNRCRKFLLVCGRSYHSLALKNDIESSGIAYTIFDDFKANPLYEDVCKGVACFRTEMCDAVVAVGGGSAIDVAKCIKLFSGMDDSVPFLQQTYSDSGIPLAAIPTTAGTGSESTRFAVIYWQGEKQSVTHDSIVPDCIFLDPAPLYTLSEYQKKCTLLDALCQGIESWWSVNSTDESKRFSKAAVETIMQNYSTYIQGGKSAAEKILRASNLAGKAINITQTTAAHAMSYKLTSLYAIPHGHAVAICLPVLWEYMLGHLEDCADLRGVEYLKQIFKDISETFSPEESSECVVRFKNMLSELDIFAPGGIKSDDLNILTASVNPVRLKNNPVRLSESVLRDLYINILAKNEKGNGDET